MMLWNKENIRILNTDRKAHCPLRNFPTTEVEIRRQREKFFKMLRENERNLGLYTSKNIFQEEE